jgi:DNA-binding XRE family transcriptional regulator
MIGPDRSRKLVVLSNPQAQLSERREFAAKVRAARAVLGWTQAELGNRIGITQRSINRLEQAGVDVRRSTAVAIERVLRDEGIAFQDIAQGGFKMLVMAGQKTRS